MDPGERRRAAAGAALIAGLPPRLLVLLGANAAAAIVLLWMVLGRDSGGVAEAATETDPGAGIAVEDPPGAAGGPKAPAGDDPTARERALDRRIATAIANAVARAEAKTRGSKRVVDASNVAVAVHVRELGGGELVAIQADQPLRPASNMKLVTVAAALCLFGPDWSFETRFERAGEIERGTLEGQIIARAAADPLYDPDGDGGLDPWLDRLAAEISAAGIERVSGTLVLDEGSFLEPGPGPAWPDEGEHWKEYAALSAGFSANAGCLTATLRSTEVGTPADVRVRPKHHGLRRRGEVTTTERKTPLEVAVEAKPYGVVVRGKIPADVSEWNARFSHPDPVELFGHAVVGGLRDRGIAIEGGFRHERGAAPGEPLATISSPLAGTVAPILRDSNNSVADQVFLALGDAFGGAGDRAGGARAVAEALRRLGVSAGGLTQVDGSGLSRDDRITPRQLTALIEAVLGGDPETAELFRSSLAVAGESGTLAKRMRSSPAEGRVFAKTGFIGGTSGLSGIVLSADGRTLVFSILVAYPVVSGLNTSCWKPMQDEICELLVAYGG